MDNGQTQPPQAQSDSQPFGFTKGIGLEPIEVNQTGNSVNTEEYNLHTPEELKAQQANLGDTAMTKPTSPESMPGNAEATPSQSTPDFMPLPGDSVETPVVGIPKELGQIGDATPVPIANKHAEELADSSNNIDDATEKAIIKAFADSKVNGKEDLSVIKQIEENPDPVAMGDQWAEARKIANNPEGEGA